MLDLTLTEQQRQLGGDGRVTLAREGDVFELADMDIAPHGPAERMARASSA